MGNFDFIKLTNGSFLFVHAFVLVVVVPCLDWRFSFRFVLLFARLLQHFRWQNVVWVASVNFQLTPHEQSDRNRFNRGCIRWRNFRSVMHAGINGNLWYFYHLRMVFRRCLSWFNQRKTKFYFCFLIKSSFKHAIWVICRSLSHPRCLFGMLNGRERERERRKRNTDFETPERNHIDEFR